MFGNIVLSVIIGAAAGFGMYLAYVTERLKAQAGANRLRSSLLVGVAVAVIGFLARYLELI